MGIIYEISKIILNPFKFIIYIKWILIYLFKGNLRLGTEIAYWEYTQKYHQQKTWGIPIFKADMLHSMKALKISFGEEKMPYHFLEIGPGPRSYLTEGYEKKLYNLKAIDPLANEFKKHLDGDEFLVQGTCEKLNVLYPRNTFHMSFARNALDHVVDPIKCVINMVKTTKVKGIIFIQGNIKEGSRKKWIGLHRHDVWVEQGKLMCTERDKEPIDLTQGLPVELYYYKEYTEVVPFFSIMYRKTC